MSEDYSDILDTESVYSEKNLKRIKKLVARSYQYAAPNYKRFSNFRRFTFKTTLSDSELTLADALNQPQVECNIGEAYVSRQRGEFAKQEPSITVMSADDSNPADPELIEFLEGHMRYILFEANNNGFEYDVYTDGLSSGFGVMKVETKYKGSFSFLQDIGVRRCDPLMVGFDMNAQLPHKGDGEFCYEVVPLTKEEFKRYFPKEDISKTNFSTNFEGFEWGYQTIHEEIILVVIFYEKKHKRTKIVECANGKVLTKKEYKEALARWELEGRIEQPPIVVNERWTDIVSICRNFLTIDRILKWEETDFSELPYVYYGGNTIVLRDPDSKTVEELSKPYLFNIYDTQKAKNLAMRVLCNQLENIVQHKWKVAKESIPDEDEYNDAYTNVQTANTLVYNAFLKVNPSSDSAPIPVPPPQEIPLVGLPPEVMQMYQICDQTMQAILGSYDASLGINDNQLSGVAIIEAATQSNAAAMPYIKSYLQTWNQSAQIILDLIPKYMKTPRTMPVLDKNGKRAYVKVNAKDGSGIQLHYSPRDLNVRVEAGVNFSIQKNRALQQIIALAQASQQFNAFINQKGLPILLDNMEIRGIDQLKKAAFEWVEQQEEAAKKGPPPNPQLIKAQADMLKAQTDAQMAQIEASIKQNQQKIEESEVQNAKMASQNDSLRILLDAQTKSDSNTVQLVKAHTEREVKGTELGMAHHDMAHRHAKETIELHHELTKQSGENK